MAKHGAVYHWPNSNPERLISRLVVAPTMYQILEAEERILVLQESIVEYDRFESGRKQNVHANQADLKPETPRNLQRETEQAFPLVVPSEITEEKIMIRYIQ